jgi:competence protein ComEC
MKKVLNKFFSISQIAILIALGFLVGIGTRSLIEVQFWWIWAVIFLLFAKLVIFRSRHLGRLLFLSLGILLGVWEMQNELISLNSLEKEFDFKGEVVVKNMPEVKEKYQEIIVSVQGEQEKEYFLERILLFAKPKPTISFGDQLQLSCKMKIPENKHEKFNYQRFLASENIFYICSSAKITKITKGKKKGFLAPAFRLREKFEEKIGILFPQAEGAYLAGLLLGGDDRLPENVAENFRITGTTHTVAVSGYNITIIASILMWLGIALGLWRQQAFWFAVFGIIFFVIMIGAPSSAARAAIMGILMLWAMQKGRLANSVRIAIFAATGMVFFSPLVLFYDVGFQLSFLATLGIILIYAPLSILVGIEDDFLELKSIVLVTIAAQLGVLGLLVYIFESFSLISILANVLILPLIPVIMLFGFSAIMLSFVFSFGAKLLALVVWLFLHFEIFAIEQLAKIPFASIEIGDVGIIWVLAYYLFFLGLIFKLKEFCR